MTDRELLEAAAKATGIEVTWVEGTPFAPMWQPDGVKVEWNPLTNDGDALRLAVNLRLDVHFEMNGPGMRTPIVEVMDGSAYDENGTAFCAMQDCTADAGAATRRAIVRAAAALGGTQSHTGGRE